MFSVVGLMVNDVTLGAVVSVALLSQLTPTSSSVIGVLIGAEPEYSSHPISGFVPSLKCPSISSVTIVTGVPFSIALMLVDCNL